MNRAMWAGRDDALPSDAITIRTRLVGAKAAAAEARALGKGVSGIGTAAGRAERQVAPVRPHAARRQQVDGQGPRLRVRCREGRPRARRRLCRRVGNQVLGRHDRGAGAKTTISLHKNLGLSVEKASEWAAVARSRDIDTKALNMSFGTLSKNIEGASKAGSSQAQIFDKLGVSQRTVASGDFNAVLGETADRLKAMGPGAERTALTMKLFGRGWQTVVPLLRDGSSEMNQQLALARKYGATFHGHTIKSLNEFIQAQRESKIATMGLQIAVGTTLIPVLTKALGVFSRFVHQMRTGKGAGGQFADTAKRIWHGAKPVVLWFGRAAVNVAKFASKHPGIVKIATALFLVTKALKLMKFGGAIRGAQTLYGWLGKTERRAETMPAKVGATQSRWATVGKMLGGVFAASFIAQLTGIEDADPLLFLHPPNAGDPRPGHGDIVSHNHGKVVRTFTRDGMRWAHYSDGTNVAIGNVIPPSQRGRHSRDGRSTRPPRRDHAPLLAPRMPVAAGGGGDGDIVVPVTVLTPNGKVLGEAVGRATRDDRNRR
jgi:hypothetical protein